MLRAQWTTGSGLIYYNGGYVGIGTASPAYPLHVNGTVLSSGSGSGFFTSDRTDGSQWAFYGMNSSARIWNATVGDVFVLTKSGYLGLGTTGPVARLDVRGTTQQNTINTVDSGGADLQVLSNNNRVNDGAILALGGLWGPTAYIKTAAINGTAGNLILGNRRLPTDTGMTAGIVLNTAGNVGIGTVNPQYPLSVNGVIQAKEVLVNTGWSDYVFAPNYHLTPIDEVAAFIKQNHHLPGVPSEAEVKEKGVGVGEMESKLLAKVEELTLHMIEIDQRNDVLAKRNRQLAVQNAAIRKEITVLKTQVAATVPKR
jgi:hypothetical protein